MSTAKFFVLKSQKIDFWHTVQNRFFKINTDSDSPSEAEPSVHFHQKKYEAKGVLALKI